VIRVALVTSSYAPRFGGVEEHVRNVAERLTARGHDAVVWTVRLDGDPVQDVVDGVRVRYLPCPLPARAAGAATRFVAALPAAVIAWRRAMRADRPEILHVHCFGPNGTYAAAMARMSRLPWVLSAHGETFADATGVFTDSALLRASLRHGLHHADAVTGCSALTLADLEDRFGLAAGRGEVVWNGIDLDEEESPLTDRVPERYVAAVGRMVDTKGFDLLLRAFAMADVPGVHLVLGGDGPALPGLRTLAAELGVADRTVFLGRLARPEVGGLMRGAQAVAVPSRTEPFGITVLEGWRSGAAVIATTRGGPAEFVADGVDGLLVDPFDLAALAAVLRRTLTDEELRGRVGAAGHSRVQAFTWDRATAHYENVYRRARARRGPPAARRSASPSRTMGTSGVTP
jgi:glycogen(starch) synthase